jgi:hypothetical protein
MAHVEELAEQGAGAELWVQHSDRLARGDGHSARHTVEIALWALKRDVKIRTLQDPDTFRDLLYAVVTGERNNEDSRRKALAAQAGRKRALARGEFIGHLPDGYRVAVDVDARNQVTKRMVRDPEREALIELIFRLALRGRTSGQIAASVNSAGWMTKPTARGSSPRPFDIERVYEVLKNPRYAALATWQGDVIARGRWPAYISERQHERIKRQLVSARPRHSRRPLESYLLAGLARCGACGGPLIARTWRRDSGWRHRSYLCASYSRHRGSARCKTPPLDAHTVEAMVIAAVANLLAGGEQSPETEAHVPAAEVPAGESARERLRAAVIAGQEGEVERSLELLFATMQADAALIRGAALSRRLARELAELRRLRSWIERESHGRTDGTRGETEELNALLRRWFSKITLTVEPEHVVIAVALRKTSAPAAPAQVSIERAAWTRQVRPHRRQLIHGFWDKAEIIGALQAFADRHGRSPTWVDWTRAGPNHPQTRTLYRYFRSWNQALHRAGLQAVPPRFTTCGTSRRSSAL